MGGEGDRVALRFGRRCRAFALLEDGAVVAYGWMSTGPEWIGELAVEIRPAAGEAYIWNCVTLPEHRRRGLYRTLLEGILAMARADGLMRLWIGSVVGPAEKADVDAGFTAVLEYEVTTRLGLRWLRIRPVARADPELARTTRSRLALVSTLAFARPRVH